MFIKDIILSQAPIAFSLGDLIALLTGFFYTRLSLAGIFSRRRAVRVAAKARFGSFNGIRRLRIEYQAFDFFQAPFVA